MVFRMTDDEHEVQRHSTMLLISSLGITFIGFLATVFYAHWVGAGTLGQYFLFLSYFAILSLFTDFGIGYAATHRICEGKEPDRYFTTSLCLRLALYVIITILIIIFNNQFGNLNESGLLWILIFVLGISTFTSSISLAIGASNRLGLAASVSLINSIVRITVQVIAVFLGFHVNGLIGGLVAGLLVELIIDLRYVDYHLKKFEWKHVKSIFSFSSWAFLITTGTVLFDNANLIIIAYFMPVSDVGIFGVCWTFSFFALFISTALCNTLFVKVSRWKAAGEMNTIAVSLSRATTYAIIFALPIFAGGLLLGQRLLYYLYGASFAVGAAALVIIIAVRVFQSIFQLYSYYLMATDHAKQAFFGMGTGITVNIFLAVVLVPIIGLSGAAIASLVNVICSVIISRHFLRNIIPIVVEKDSWMHIIIATIIMTISLLIIDQIPISQSAIRTAVLVLIGGGIYFFVLLNLNKRIREDAFRTLKIQWIPQ
jgi:O-antigen/teichoic acid export membrane protein